MPTFLQWLNQFIDTIFQHPFLFSLLLIVFLQLSTKWLFKSSNKKNIPPSPRKLPVLGNMHQLSSLPHQSLHALAIQHGPVMLLHFGSVPTVIISSPDAASQIMKTNDLIFSNRPETTLGKRLLYDMKTTSTAPYGEYWRQLRTICVLQLLSNKRVQSFHSIREEETTIMMKMIEDFCSCSSPVDLSEMFASLTNNIVSRAAFGKKFSEGETGKRLKKLFKEFLELLGTISVGEFIPWLSWINRVNGFDAKVDQVAKEVDEFLQGVVQERLNHGLETKRDDLKDQGERREDFVDILVRIYKDNTTGVSIDICSIKALLLDVYSAGTDTTSTVLEWAMAELLRHPKIMKNLQNEIREVVNGKKDVTDYDLPKMQYLKCVIKETLRLHPPIPLLVPRVASSDVKIMGYDIRAGTRVMINAWAIGRDPSYWDVPEMFKPERFLNSSIDFTGHDFQLIPFGAGRRGCPGISFAMATNELVLANLVHKFDWKLPNGESLDMTERPGLTIFREVPLLAMPTPSY